MIRVGTLALALWLYVISAASASSPAAFPTGVPKPLRVNVSVFVLDLKQLDESAGTYQGYIQLRYRWRDPALAFSESRLREDFESFADEEALEKLAAIWNPKIVVKNLVQGGSSVTTGLIIRADGTVELLQRIRGSFETRLKLDAFPFDRQNLPVVILSSRYASHQVMLVQDDEANESGFAPTLELPGWNIEQLKFKREQVVAWNGLPVEQITANLGIKRIASSVLSTVFIPLLLLMIVPTIVSLIPTFELPARLSAWAGSILALVALNFTLTVRYPGPGEGSLIAQAVLLGHLYQLVSVLLTVTLFDAGFRQRIGNPFIARELSDYLQWAVPAAFIGVLVFQTLLTATAS